MAIQEERELGSHDMLSKLMSEVIGRKACRHLLIVMKMWAIMIKVMVITNGDG